MKEMCFSTFPKFLQKIYSVIKDFISCKYIVTEINLIVIKVNTLVILGTTAVKFC